MSKQAAEPGAIRGSALIGAAEVTTEETFQAFDPATGGVRASGGWATAESDWSRFADAWIAAYDKHKTRAAERVREVA